jgi:hypothetical protein
MSTTPPTARPPAASTGGHQARASPNRHQRPTRDDAIHRRAHPGRPSQHTTRRPAPLHREGVRDALWVPILTGTRPSARFSRLPGGLVPCHTARARRCPQPCWPGWPIASSTCSHRARPAGAGPRRCRWRSAWTRLPRSSWTGCRPGAPAGRLGSPRPRSATASTCCSVSLPPWGTASPTGPSSPPWPTLASGSQRWPPAARRCPWTGWPRGCSDPPGGPTRRSSTTPSAAPTPPRALPSRPSTGICCGWMAAGRAAATSTRSSNWQGCRGAG